MGWLFYFRAKVSTRIKYLEMLFESNPSSVAASSGQPPTFSGDWAIDQACGVGNKYTLPENLRTQLLIYKFNSRVNKVMTESERSATGYPPAAESYVLMAMLETDFCALERQIDHEETSILNITTHFSILSY
jgi:hypothetical protein